MTIYISLTYFHRKQLIESHLKIFNAQFFFLTHTIWWPTDQDNKHMWDRVTLTLGQKQWIGKRWHKSKDHGSANTILWKDKTEVDILTKINQPPAEGNFCDKMKNALKQPIVEYYNKHKGYIAQSDQIANSYSIPSSGQQNSFFYFL